MRTRVRGAGTTRHSLSITFGRSVRRAREAHGWTQATLAERASLDVSYVSQIERGRRDPSLTSIDALATALGVPLSELLAGQAHDDGLSAALRTIRAELRDLPESVLAAAVAAVRAVRSAARGR